MLAMFPDILFLAPFSVLAIRIALTATLVYSAWQHLAHGESAVGRILGVLEIAAACAIAVGAWTQLGGIAASLILLGAIALPHTRTTALGTTLLAFVMATSLIITGPGVFSFDLPL